MVCWYSPQAMGGFEDYPLEPRGLADLWGGLAAVLLGRKYGFVAA